MPHEVRLRWAVALLAPITMLAVPAPASAAPAGPAAAGVRVDLGSLGGGQTFPEAINASGQVAGNSRTATGETHAFLWSDGVMTDLGTAPGGTTSLAVGLTDDGRVVGYGDAPAGGGVFVWRAGVRTELPTGDFAYPRPVGINGAGTVIGSYDTPFGTRAGFLWRDGVLVDLGTLVPALINDAGVVVGLETLGAGGYRVVRLDGQVRTDLGTLTTVGDEQVQLVDLTERGDIAAQVPTADGYRSYVRRAGATGWRQLSGLRGATYVRVTALNEVGDAAGTSNSGPATLGRAVRWRGAVVRALPSLGGSSSEAYDLNDRGVVAGFSTTAAGSAHAAIWRGTGVVDIGPAGAASSANDLNEVGQAVGSAFVGGSLDDYSGFRWTP